MWMPPRSFVPDTNQIEQNSLMNAHKASTDAQSANQHFHARTDFPSRSGRIPEA